MIFKTQQSAFTRR